jgi:hypothetical protein
MEIEGLKVPHNAEQAMAIFMSIEAETNYAGNNRVEYRGLLLGEETYFQYRQEVGHLVQLQEMLMSPEIDFEQMRHVTLEMVQAEQRIRALAVTRAETLPLVEVEEMEVEQQKREKRLLEGPRLKELPCEVVTALLIHEVAAGNVSGSEYRFVMNVARVSKYLLVCIIASDALWTTMLLAIYGLKFTRLDDLTPEFFSRALIGKSPLVTHRARGTPIEQLHDLLKKTLKYHRSGALKEIKVSDAYLLFMFMALWNPQKRQVRELQLTVEDVKGATFFQWFEISPFPLGGKKFTIAVVRAKKSPTLHVLIEYEKEVKELTVNVTFQVEKMNFFIYWSTPDQLDILLLMNDNNYLVHIPVKFLAAKAPSVDRIFLYEDLLDLYPRLEECRSSNQTEIRPAPLSADYLTRLLTGGMSLLVEKDKVMAIDFIQLVKNCQGAVRLPVLYSVLLNFFTGGHIIAAARASAMESDRLVLIFVQGNEVFIGFIVGENQMVKGKLLEARARQGDFYTKSRLGLLAEITPSYVILPTMDGEFLNVVDFWENPAQLGDIRYSMITRSERFFANNRVSLSVDDQGLRLTTRNHWTRSTVTTLALGTLVIPGAWVPKLVTRLALLMDLPEPWLRQALGDQEALFFTRGPGEDDPLQAHVKGIIPLPEKIKFLGCLFCGNIERPLGKEENGSVYCLNTLCQEFDYLK